MSEVTKKMKKFKTGKDRNARLGKNPLSWFVFIILAFCSFYVAYKLIWGLLTSFKDVNEFMDNKLGFPKEWAFENYLYVFKNFHITITNTQGVKRVWIEQLFLNSLMFAGIGALLQVATIAWVSYLVAKFAYKLSNIIYTMVLLVQVIPLVNSSAATLKLMRNLGIYDTYFSFWLMKLSFTNMQFLLLYPSWRAIPKDYSEAAIIDGAGEGMIFFKVNLPMVMPLLLTFILTNFVAYWNDYMTPLIYTPSQPTLSYGVYILTNTNIQGFSRTPMRMSTSYLAGVPMILVFILFRKQIMRKMSLGGLKE